MTMTTTSTASMFTSIEIPRPRPSRFDLSSFPHRNPSGSSLRQPLPRPTSRNNVRVGVRDVAAAARLQLKAMMRASGYDRGELSGLSKSTLSVHVGAVLMSMVEQPAFAVTGVNNQEDLIWVITQIAIVAFWYFLIMPPIIMNWLRIRWYRRNLLEMYLQFMFVFMFFPGVLLWAPFLNFRKFPRDPSLKYPWSEPEDPSQVKNAFLKYPFAQPEDYD